MKLREDLSARDLALGFIFGCDVALGFFERFRLTKLGLLNFVLDSHHFRAHGTEALDVLAQGLLGDLRSSLLLRSLGIENFGVKELKQVLFDRKATE